MFREVQSAVMQGLECRLIRVEVDVCDGLPGFEMVGYLAGEVREAKERVRAALRNCGFALPAKKIIVNLSPGDVRKAGTAFDLPIAIALLAAFGMLPPQVCQKLESTLILGELSLCGEVKRVRGVLPIAASAQGQGITTCIFPEDNVREGALGTSLPCYGVKTLGRAVDVLMGHTDQKPEKLCYQDICRTVVEMNQALDFQDIVGQSVIKRAAEIAAAGFHNLLMIGPPGAGKTMIARRIPGILPPLSMEEGMELSKIYSVAGMLSPEQPFIMERPFRAPHHRITGAAMVGGGKIPVPGEVTLAHRSVLFLDELSEFPRAVLEVLRQPLEDRQVALSRVGGRYVYPANFMLVAAMNPCACGHYPDLNRCTCSHQELKNYIGKISQPLLDRMDLCVEIPKVEFEQLQASAAMAGEKCHQEESSETIRKRVIRAKKIQDQRYQGTPFQFNADLNVQAIRQYCPLEKEAQSLLKSAYEKLDLSARAYHRLIRVARTIADLEGSAQISQIHMAEAISYRSINKKFWE